MSRIPRCRLSRTLITAPACRPWTPCATLLFTHCFRLPKTLTQKGTGTLLGEIPVRLNEISCRTGCQPVLPRLQSLDGCNAMVGYSFRSPIAHVAAIRRHRYDVLCGIGYLTRIRSRSCYGSPDLRGNVRDVCVGLASTATPALALRGLDGRGVSDRVADFARGACAHVLCRLYVRRDAVPLFGPRRTRTSIQAE